MELLARWRTDALELPPEVVSILVGVNETWHRLTKNQRISPAEYEVAYRRLLSRTR